MLKYDAISTSQSGELWHTWIYLCVLSLKYSSFILQEHACINKQDPQRIYEFKEGSGWFRSNIHVHDTLYRGFKNVEIYVL